MLKVEKLTCEYKKNPLGIDILMPRLSWQIKSAKRNVLQTAYQIQVSENNLSFESIVWDTKKVCSNQSIHIEYNGPELKSCCKYFYKVRIWDNFQNVSDWSEVSYFEMGLIKPSNWSAKWIVADLNSTSKYQPSPMFRKSFSVNKKIKSARVYVTSLGLYELHLNGNKVGDSFLTPGWTSYNKRLQYQTYDVSNMLVDGENAAGAILGDGWYKGDLVWEDSRNLYGDKCAFLFQMHIVYEDGRKEVIISDQSWKSSYGPILMSQIYHGETYDARLELPNWDTNNFDDSLWVNALEIEHSKDILTAQENVPVEKIQNIKPIEIIKTPLGETVIDMGQNMVGFVKFSVKGCAGDKVILKHAEVLDKDGNFYIDNLRLAKQTIEYILKGEGIETFEPHFTFQGFRYVKVESYPGEIKLDNFTGVVIHSCMEQTGSFECSDELVNKLQHNILWGQKGNFVDVPTDCPQRNERLGWTGDAQVFIRTACYNMNTAPFFTKWLKDLQSDQYKDGGVPFVIPDVIRNSKTSAAWGDAAVICPWTIYLCFGDKKILIEQYESMKSWVEYIRKQGDNPYLWNTGFHFGDWLGLDAKENSYIGATSKDYIATAFYAYCTDILVKVAKVLRKEDDVKSYSQLYDKIIQNFRLEFVTPTGRLAVPTQTAYVLALMFNLIDEKYKKRTIETLVEYIKENKDHLTTGFVGTPYICHVLSENGYADIAYKLLLQKDYPSWLYQITKGATTIWEHWDGVKTDGTFWSADMNSFNHYAYGAIGDWLYRVVSGINLDEENPGYKHIIINPNPGGNLTFAKSSFESMYGQIISDWKINDQNMFVNIEIPHNTTAKVILPSADTNGLLLDNKNIEGADGVLSFKDIESGVLLELGSGTYSFKYNYR